MIFLQNMKPWMLLHVEVELCILMMLIWHGVIKKGTALPFAALRTINSLLAGIKGDPRSSRGRQLGIGFLRAGPLGEGVMEDPVGWGCNQGDPSPADKEKTIFGRVWKRFKTS